MILAELELRNFRNYQHAVLSLSPRVNIFYGENAQGKTNLLEAISLLSIGRSFRTKKETELIRWEEENCYLKGIYSDQLEQQQIEIGIALKEKKIKLNGQICRMGDLPHIPVVIFSPDDLQMIKGGPQLRRDFLDFYLVQMEPQYRYIYYNYYKVLQQRNKYLKDGVKDRDLMDTWDEQLIVKGAKVIKYRLSFLGQIREAVAKAHHAISGQSESIGFHYLCFQNQVFEEEGEEAALKEIFRQELKKVRNWETERGITLVGPHRDDISFLLNHQIELRNFGSQGQQRTAVLALKLGLVEKITENRGVQPLILLDDVMSEFDDARKRYLLEMLLGTAQTFLTSTNRRDFPITEGEPLFLRVAQGMVTHG